MAITGDIIITNTRRVVGNLGSTRDVEFTKTIANARFLEWDQEITASLVDTTIWDATATPAPALTSFDFLEMTCDITIQVELVIDEGGTPRVMPIVMEANAPFTLYGDDGLDGTGASISDAFTAGVVAQINKIAVKEVVGVAGELNVFMAKQV